ncbi:hypothetical protein M595_5989, partial [Lyngbya aestuarii BL J]
GLFHSQLKIAGVDGESTPVRGNKRVEGSGYPVGGERVMGGWGEEFFPRKNSFLLIKIVPTSLPPYLPTPPQIKF